MMERQSGAAGRPTQPIVIRIRDLRRERSLTQEELAASLGLSRQSVNAMEAGRCLPSLPVALQIARFFAVPLTALFGLPEADVSSPHVVHARLEVKGKEAAMAQIVPWSPLREMREMLDELMDESAAWTAPVAVTAPAVNISQGKDDVCVELRLPGLTKDDISLEVGDGYLTVSGAARHESGTGADPEEGRQYFRREFVTQSFSRTVSLPTPVQAEKAAAEMRNGILRVVLPKVVEEKPKTTKVEIRTE